MLPLLRGGSFPIKLPGWTPSVTDYIHPSTHKYGWYDTKQTWQSFWPRLSIRLCHIWWLWDLKLGKQRFKRCTQSETLVQFKKNTQLWIIFLKLVLLKTTVFFKVFDCFNSVNFSDSSTSCGGKFILKVDFTQNRTMLPWFFCLFEWLKLTF